MATIFLESKKSQMQLSRTMKSLRFYSSYKLVSWPGTLVWVLTEGIRLLGQKQRTLLFLAVYVCLCVCVCVCVHTCVCLHCTQLCLTLSNPIDCSLPGFSVHGDSPGKNTGVGCHDLLQGIFPTRDGTLVSLIAGGFFTIWATREA